MASRAAATGNTSRATPATLLSTPRGNTSSSSIAPQQQRGRAPNISAPIANHHYRSSSAASSSAAAARTRSGSATNRSVNGTISSVVSHHNAHHPLVRPATWTSTPIGEDGQPDTSRSASCATTTLGGGGSVAAAAATSTTAGQYYRQHVDPSHGFIHARAPSPHHQHHQSAASHSLLIDELSAVDSFSFGNDAIGSVRLDYTSTSKTTPPPVISSTTTATSAAAHDSSAISSQSTTTPQHRYVSPFGLRDPVSLRIDRTSVTITHVASSSQHAATPLSSSSTSAPVAGGGAVVLTIPFTAMARVELRRDGSLLLRRNDEHEVVISMHSAPKVVSAYKILMVRCRGAFPKNTDDATYTIERQLNSNHNSGAAAAVEVEEEIVVAAPQPQQQPTTATITDANVSSTGTTAGGRRIASSSPSLPQQQRSASSSVSRKSPQVSSVVSSSIHVDIPPVQLPPPRTIPNRTAKTPITSSTSSAAGGAVGTSDAAAAEVDDHSTPRLGPSQSSASSSPKPHVRVQHNLTAMTSPSSSSSAAIASRDERRQQLRAQLLNLRKERVLPL